MSDHGVSLEAKLAALRRTDAYPDWPHAVDSVETHMSWVFLTQEHAYKLKKPVRYDGLNFSTLSTRRFYCSEELRLNRRLTRDVYLDVVALRLDSLGGLRIGPEGTVVDWLVMMRRLPEKRMLDHLLSQALAQGLPQPDLRPVAAQLAGFYRSLRPAVTDTERYLRRLRRDIDDCERKLRDPELAGSIEDARPLCARLRSLLHDRVDLFDARVQGGRIVEGHGDLRPEHICMETPPAIIDCLEFSIELRTLDVADELGFLGLECERLGAPRLGPLLLDVYGELSGDFPDPVLINYYQALRACIRASLALWHLKEVRYRGTPRWALRARHYLRLAGEHLQRCANPA